MRINELKRHTVLTDGVLGDVRWRLLDWEIVTDESVNLTIENLRTRRVEKKWLYDAQLDEIREVLPDDQGSPMWAMEGDAEQFRLVAEAYRIRLAWLFDPQMAVHTSLIDPLPHQLAAVYETMLPRQPLRFLLADDPGAGKTIMAGLFLRELMLRDDVRRCLVVVPANLAEQWQDEILEKFNIQFTLLDGAARSAPRGLNPLSENNLAIARIDTLKRPEQREQIDAADDWDLIIVDEAHKMSARYDGYDIRQTDRYRLGGALGVKTRHLLLMTATPHSGIEENFQLFLRLLDLDRFEGRYRSSAHSHDISDLMRRVMKEDLLGFDGRRLFPDRVATTVGYELRGLELQLYEEVTNYVRTEMGRADELRAVTGGKQRGSIVGFALTVLQRRLASSPAAIHESLKRRKARLEERLEEALAVASDSDAAESIGQLPHDADVGTTDEDREADLDEAPEEQIDEIVDLATAARTVKELQGEIDALAELVSLSHRLLRSRKDRKWMQLLEVLNDPRMKDATGQRQKLVIFTEHRDTLEYLATKIRLELRRDESVVTIHGGLRRGQRREAQDAFLNDPAVEVLVATDAAGEGVNLQVAHLMVNYDLPWNPNRLEQRFGRIHRFRQRDTCYLWNLVAANTREGRVYERLLEKLDVEKEALGGKVYDVLGRALTELNLRDLMITAIREPSAFPKATVAQLDLKWTHDRLKQLIDESALHAVDIPLERVKQIEEEMLRAQMQRLIPHFIETFFVGAFRHLGGRYVRRKNGLYEIRRIPPLLKERRHHRTGARLPDRYERVCFDKDYINLDKSHAEFVAPGHPLLDAVVEALLERHQEILQRGAILIDDHAESDEPRLMVAVETSAKIASGSDGEEREIGKWVDYVELTASSEVSAGSAPYLDYRPPQTAEIEQINQWQRPNWVRAEDGSRAIRHVAAQLLPERIEHLTNQRRESAQKTRRMVKNRLESEIRYWRQRAGEIARREHAGHTPKLNSELMRARANELQARLDARLAKIDREQAVVATPPVITAVCLVLPSELLNRDSSVADLTEHRRRIERVAMDAVTEDLQQRGYACEDVSIQNTGWDIEAKSPDGSLLFVEVKGRKVGEAKVALSRNEYLAASNRPDSYVLAVVNVDGEDHSPPTYRRIAEGKSLEHALASIQLKSDDLKPFPIDPRNSDH